MLEIGKTAILGAIQGLTEFLPVSSSGHLVLLHDVLNTHTPGSDLAFDALLHLATALAVIVYFRHDIADLVRSFFSLIRKCMQGSALTTTTGEKMVIAIILGTIPAVVLGVLLESIMDTLFRNPLLVAGTLVFGSVVMLVAEHTLSRRSSTHESVHWKEGLLIGCFQCLALIPGMSRSGMTISGGMFLGLSREFAAKFGFLLGVPVMLGAGAKKILELSQSSMLSAVQTDLVVGALAAFLVGLAVVHYLLKFLNRHSLKVFVVYRILLALVIVLVVLL